MGPGQATAVFIAGLVAVALYVRIVIHLSRRTLAEDDEGWARSAGARGLDTHRARSGRHVTGRMDGAEVEVHQGSVPPSSMLQGTSVLRRGRALRPVMAVRREGALPRSLSLRLDTRVRAISRSFGGEDHTIGDPAFDRAVEVKGDRVEALALLDQEARRALQQLLVRHHGRVENGALISDGMPDTRPGPVLSQLDSLVELSAILSFRGKSANERLAANARSDVSEGVRYRNFQALRELEGDGSPRTTEVARALLTDPLVSLRLEAARCLGRPGLGVLEGIFGDESLDAELRARALAALVELDPVGSRARVSLASACAHAALRREATRALHARGGAEVEPELLSLLGDESAEVQLAAALALGDWGRVGSVEALLRLAASNRVDHSVANAARQAARRVQSRLGDAEAGLVSLSHGEATEGRVDVVEVRPGERHDPRRSSR